MTICCYFSHLIFVSLFQASKNKDVAALKQWIDPIVNHFWYSCQTCNGDLEDLKNKWFGVVHHVCGEHKWGDSRCSHGPLTAEEPKEFLSKSSKSAEALRTIVYDKRFIGSLSHYIHFRHTSALENFNSMLTKYAPKRIAFEYVYILYLLL